MTSTSDAFAPPGTVDVEPSPELVPPPQEASATARAIAAIAAAAREGVRGVKLFRRPIYEHLFVGDWMRADTSLLPHGSGRRTPRAARAGGRAGAGAGKPAGGRRVIGHGGGLRGGGGDRARRGAGPLPGAGPRGARSGARGRGLGAGAGRPRGDRRRGLDRAGRRGVLRHSRPPWALGRRRRGRARARPAGDRAARPPRRRADAPRRRRGGAPLGAPTAAIGSTPVGGGDPGTVRRRPRRSGSRLPRPTADRAIARSARGRVGPG